MHSNGLPQHVAIIMDGNGRWAKKHHLPRTKGHLEGIKRVEEVIAIAARIGIKVLTLYTFSTENWSRPRAEVSMLMKAFIATVNKRMTNLKKQNIKIQFIGRREGIPKDVLKCMDAAARLTKDNTGMILNIAFNYGARPEILDAVKTIAVDIKDKKISINDITEQTFSDALYTVGLPDPDLLIRTSGEKRISNFLLWQLSYTELYFTEKYWPEFTTKEFKKAISDFKGRERRYGRISAVKK